MSSIKPFLTAAAGLTALAASLALWGCGGPSVPTSGSTVPITYTVPAGSDAAAQQTLVTKLQASVLSRLQGLGLADAQVTSPSAGTVQVQLPGFYPAENKDDAKALGGLRRVLERPGHLEISLVAVEQEALAAAKAPAPAGYRVVGPADHPLYLTSPAGPLTNAHVLKAESHASVDGKFVVALTFTEAGSKLLKTFTEENAKRTAAILVDDELGTILIIGAPITSGQAAINGLSEQQSVWLAMLLNSGELPGSLKVGEPVPYGKKDK